jgi:hypothetical protein
LPVIIEWLSDNRSCYIAGDTRSNLIRINRAIPVALAARTVKVSRSERLSRVRFRPRVCVGIIFAAKARRCFSSVCDWLVSASANECTATPDPQL